MADLARIVSLPMREPVNCTRDPITRRYVPATQALIEVITARFARPARVSCACRPRRIEKLDGQRVRIWRVLPEQFAPEPPIEMTVAALEADNRTTAEELKFARDVAAMRPGTDLLFPAASGENGYPCILEFNGVQAWTIKEAVEVGGIIAFSGVGSGKCLESQTEIFDVVRGRRRLVSELGPVVVPSFDGKHLGPQKGEAFASGTKRCFTLTLAERSAVTLSFDHKVFTHRGWVEAQHLTTNDFVAVPTRVPEPLCPTEASDDEVALVALITADGSCNNGTIIFTDDNPKVLDEFQRLAHTLCGGCSERRTRSRAREFSLLGANSTRGGNGFRDRWDLHGLSKEKRVHPDVWGLPTSQVALFLNRFWACDGHVSKIELECTLASEKLIDDLRFLLLRIGVRSRKRFKLARCAGKTYNAWRIIIAGKDALHFLNTVGDVLGSEERCIALRTKLETSKRNTNFDVVPIGRPELYEICDELGYRRAVRGEGSRRSEIVRGYFNATAGQFVSRERFIEFCEKHRYDGKYAHLATRDLAWERVESLVDAGDREVFDLSVPATKNFIANNMLVHNTISNIIMPLAFPELHARNGKPPHTAALLIEPKQRLHYKSHYLRLREHFRVSSIVFDDGSNIYVEGTPVLHLISYSKLSHKLQTNLLEQLNPDWLGADEGHRACGESAINRRFKRFLAWKIRVREDAMARGEPVLRRATILVVQSGTLEVDSIEDTQMPCAYALGTGSPLPLDKNTAKAWSAVFDIGFDIDRTSATAKALYKAFGNGVDPEDFIVFDDNDGPEKALREGFQYRRVRTRGIITANAPDVNAAIYVCERKIGKTPQKVSEALARIRKDWIRPDGEQFDDKMLAVSCARQIAAGYFNYWIFPKHPCTCPVGREMWEPKCDECSLIDEWFLCRKAYYKDLRRKLVRGEPYLDSEENCRAAAERFWQTDPPYKGNLPKWECESFPKWRAIEKRVSYEERVDWIDDYMARDAADWAMKNKGVVWFLGTAMGRKIEELTGLPYFNGGPGVEQRMSAEKGNRSIIVSLGAHANGTDGLQHIFSEQLFVEMPSSNATARGFEQLFGRLHREGQRAEIVYSHVYTHASEFTDQLYNARVDAHFNYAMTKNMQKMLCATFDFDF